MLSMFFLGVYAGLMLATAIAFYAVLFGKVKFTKNVAKKNIRKFWRNGCRISWKEASHVYIYRIHK